MTEVLIDATGLGDDSAFRGIGTYLRHLLAGLAGEPDLSVTALVREGTIVPDAIRAVPVRRLAPGRLRRAEHDLLLPIALRRHRADVFHSPALDPPLHHRGPWVQTIHDLIPLVYSDAALAGERRRLERQARRYRAADAVLAVSEYTAREAVAVLGLDPNRVEVAPHGVGAEFRPPAARGDSERPYMLSVGEYSRRKGYPEAFAVIGALAELGYPHTLRVSGRVAPWVAPTVKALVAAAPRPDRIELLGYVDDLVAQYQQASVLLVTSRYEGFGFPMLEAMACGTPVVAFANSSITEVVGDAGLLVADGDVDAFTVAVRSVLDDGPRWRELSERGLERAASFTWERSVRVHAHAYRSVGG